MENRFSKADYICKRCHNTGKNLQTSHPCGCIEGEILLNKESKQNKDSYARRLAETLVKDGVIHQNAWEHGRTSIIEAIRSSLEEVKSEESIMRRENKKR